VIFSLDVNEASVLIEWRPRLKELQTQGTEREKARDAKVRVNCPSSKLVEDDISCLTG